VNKEVCKPRIRGVSSDRLGGAGCVGPVTGVWASQEDTLGVAHILCPRLCLELQLCQALPSVSQRSLGGFSLSGDGHHPSPVWTGVTFLPGSCAGEPEARRSEVGVWGHLMTGTLVLGPGVGSPGQANSHSLLDSP
jgi:hypothetical protein